LQVNLVGHGPAERLLKNATMLSAKQALAIGLIDEIVPSSDLDAAAAKHMRKLLRLPGTSYAITKTKLRAKLANDWEAQADAEAASGWSFLSQPQTIKSLGNVLKRLSGNKKRNKNKSKL
jgi:enoyl-CoA hydratase/carnithine racemase